MPSVVFTARNPLDTTLRYWGIGIDKLPVGNWLKDPDIIKSQRYQGDVWSPEIGLSDGKHVLYFIVSQTDPLRGGYEGEAAFPSSGTGFNFRGIDNDTVATLPVIVKGGNIKRDQNASQAVDKDIPENAFSGFSKGGQVLGSLAARMKDAWANKKKEIGIVAIVIVVAVGAICIFKRLKGKSRF